MDDPGVDRLSVPDLIQKDCFSCHSNHVDLAWFDEIAPAYWLVRHDILEARKHLNFSTLEPRARNSAFFESANMIQFGEMPPSQFTLVHPEAKVTPEELAALKRELAPWSPLKAGNPDVRASGAIPANRIYPFRTTSNVTPEFNGLPFDSGFENWKLISVTDRGDNNTFRLILGNEVALRAARSGNVSPWPDGTRFAKIAWQQELGGDNLVHPGDFVQVELMIKDAGRYKDTEGWNWGRWRGLDLKPYGADARFVEECTGCHRPMKPYDYVYTLPVAAAKVSRTEALNVQAAAFPDFLPYQPLAWNTITMMVDRQARTMSVLVGNDAAIRSARTTEAASKKPAYEPGSVVALVTWAQREDPHWFGGRIPEAPQSVEFVTAGGPLERSYRRFAGAGLAEDHSAANIARERAGMILGLPAAILP